MRIFTRARAWILALAFVLPLTAQNKAYAFAYIMEPISEGVFVSNPSCDGFKQTLTKMMVPAEK
ncbi:MAG: hypothetical protein LBL59_03995 [Xanthomonadaceae bacterium]|nr:hypothetical protein [Xanthomonadaceae bacterium]